MNHIHKIFSSVVLVLIAMIFLRVIYNYRQTTTPPPPTTEPLVQKETTTPPPPSSSEIPFVSVDDFIPFVFRAQYVYDLRPVEAWREKHILSSRPLSHQNDTLPAKTRVALFAHSTQSVQSLLPIYKKFLSQDADVRIYRGTLEEYKQHGGSVIEKNDITDFVSRSKVSFVEPRDINTAITQQQDYAIIDVRREGNYKTAHVPGAQNFPEDSLETTYKNIPRDKKVLYLYGANHQQSFDAAALLFDLGFFNVKTMAGGFAAWEKYGYPTVQ